MQRTIEQRTLSKVSWRLLPLIVVIYFVAYMDRTNVSFASLSMNQDLGFTVAFLTGPAAAGGIALVNSIGNLGGFVGSYAVGWIKDATGSFEAGLYFLAACSLASAVIAFFGLRPAVVELKRPIALELAK